MTDQNTTRLIQQQLVELQSQLAFQEDTIQALNEVVTRQQQQIENLNELLQQQQGQLELIAEDAGKGAVMHEERPPHY